eukprot:3250090-Pyramimonas_sp.AAC.1
MSPGEAALAMGQYCTACPGTNVTWRGGASDGPVLQHALVIPGAVLLHASHLPAPRMTKTPGKTDENLRENSHEPKEQSPQVDLQSYRSIRHILDSRIGLSNTFWIVI